MESKAKILRDYGRMCRDGAQGSCFQCELRHKAKTENISCQEFMKRHPEEAVAIIEAWAKAHPERTYLTDFLEKYPKAKMEPSGAPTACAAHLGYVKDCGFHDDCLSCWNSPMEVTG